MCTWADLSRFSICCRWYLVLRILYPSSPSCIIRPCWASLCSTVWQTFQNKMMMSNYLHGKWTTIKFHSKHMWHTVICFSQCKSLQVAEKLFLTKSVNICCWLFLLHDIFALNASRLYMPGDFKWKYTPKSEITWANLNIYLKYQIQYFFMKDKRSFYNKKCRRLKQSDIRYNDKSHSNDSLNGTIFRWRWDREIEIFKATVVNTPRNLCCAYLLEKPNLLLWGDSNKY